VLRREITTVIGIEHLGNAADMPARLMLTPDRLPKGERGLDRRRGRQRQEVPCDRPAVIIQYDCQPGLVRLSAIILDQNIKLRVIRLPDSIGCFRFRAVHQIEGFAVHLRALMSERYQGRLQTPDQAIDGGVTWYGFTPLPSQEDSLAVHRCY
jgi:hypothetical protein